MKRRKERGELKLSGTFSKFSESFNKRDWTNPPTCRVVVPQGQRRMVKSIKYARSPKTGGLLIVINCNKWVRKMKKA